MVVFGDSMADWLAYGLEDAFADAPEFAYGGEWPADAIEALLAAHPERGALAVQISALDDAVHGDHLEFVVPLATEACPDCGNPMKLRQGRGNWFLGCSKYPKCRGTKEAPPEVLEQIGAMAGA